MTTTITITAKTWDEARVGEADPRHAVARAEFSTEWAGEIAGRSTCWLLISYVDGDPAQPQSLVGPYVGYEQVEATIGDRSGTFVLAVTGEHTGETARTQVRVVENSGTGALAGIRGSGSYAATATTYELELDYAVG